MNIQRFESLGDNCEFGFVLGRFGQTQSSLLRWSLTSVPALIRGIETDFAQLYAIEDLEPSHKRMLLDRGSGFNFHSSMVQDRQFVAGHSALYPKELEKIEALRARLLAQMSDPTMIFVYKDRTNPPLEDVAQLAQVLHAKGGAHLLYVTTQGQTLLGAVQSRGRGLLYARIDEFADYASANEAAFPLWQRIMRAAEVASPATTGVKTH